MKNQVLHRALEYAGRGWPVFPCQPGKKAPATPHGYRDATTDPALIRAWFDGRPDLNLAVATGAPGPDVLDVDERGAAGHGFGAMTRLSEAGLLAGASGMTRTPGGGLHLYFTGSQQRTAHLPASHLDFLAQGGYALLPPSQVNGNPYQHISSLTGNGELDWTTAARLLDPSRDLASADLAGTDIVSANLTSTDLTSAGRGPASAGPALTGRAPQQHGQAPAAQMSRLARFVAAQPEGNRNNGLFWAANRALETDMAADLSPLAAAARQAGLTDPEITRTLQSARHASHPRPQAAPPQAHPEPNGREAEGAS